MLLLLVRGGGVMHEGLEDMLLKPTANRQTDQSKMYE